VKASHYAPAPFARSGNAAWLTVAAVGGAAGWQGRPHLQAAAACVQLLERLLECRTFTFTHMRSVPETFQSPRFPPPPFAPRLVLPLPSPVSSPTVEHINPI
jgi:hypothetical protein